MAMTYNTLTASKGSPGSILNWGSWGKIDVFTIVDEAQFLLYESLRVREMKESWTFGFIANQASIPLPTRFLDPIGKIYDLTNQTSYDQLNESDILNARIYDTSLSGSLGSSPFTTTAGSGLVSVNQPSEVFSEGSSITIVGATALNGLTLNGTFPISSVTDTNDFVINVGGPTDTVASASGSGGGAAATYTGNNLIASSPTRWGVWSERIHLDCSMQNPAAMKLLFYRRPQLLSATNLTNFLTDRYPKLMRTACLAAVAEFMKDDPEYQKQVTALSALIQNTAIENDFIYRGAVLGTDTP